MMGFERYNKYLKQHVHNFQHPEINLAKNVAQDATAHYFELEEDEKYNLPPELYHRY